MTPQEWLQRPGTVGRAWPNSDVRVEDDEGRPCEPGVPGTVYLSLGQADFEYHRDAEKTKAGRRDGFFTVGDVGYLDEAGYLFLCDRKADMIISGGVNIYPAEIEAVIHEHPGILDVAVFGIPDDEWGERVHAVVQPKHGVTLDLDELPRTDSGKLLKRVLRDEFWTGRETSV